MTTLHVGEWRINPASGQLSRNGETTRLDARTMRLLLCLAERPGEVVSIDDLLNQVWSGVNVSQDSVYQAVTSLRRTLGDDPKQPTYIETVPRLGYRMVARVATSANPSSQVSNGDHSNSSAVKPEVRHKVILAVVAGAALCLALMTGLLVHSKSARSQPTSATIAVPAQNSIAVLPFLDLTEGMKEEEFADGMTEELIGRLSKVSDFRVPAPTASFYFKERQMPVVDIAKALGVVYVLDGSVRKSGNKLRVATRLVKADNGYVLWSETYDRSLNDILAVQDDVADKVTKALRESIAHANKAFH